MTHKLFLATVLTLVASGITGCGSPSGAKSSDQQVKDFKGGPMPDSVRKSLEEQQAKSRDLAAKGREDAMKKGGG